MARGGARNRSGPQPDEMSITSARNGVVFTALPPDGHKGVPPEFPLPGALDRELEVWESLWRTPQATVWAVEPWRWRVVAMYTRWSVRMEDIEASAALVSQVIRMGDQIGLTPAGMKENGWKIADPEPSRATGTNGTSRSSSRARLKVVGNGDGSV